MFIFFPPVGDLGRVGMNSVLLVTVYRFLGLPYSPAICTTVPFQEKEAGVGGFPFGFTNNVCVEVASPSCHYWGTCPISLALQEWDGRFVIFSFSVAVVLQVFCYCSVWSWWGVVLAGD